MMDQLIRQVGEQFAKIKAPRANNNSYYLNDSLKRAFAMFSLKDPSLLIFRQRFEQRQENLKRIFGLEQIPGDTAMRKSIDGIPLSQIFDLIPALSMNDIYCFIAKDQQIDYPLLE